MRDAHVGVVSHRVDGAHDFMQLRRVVVVVGIEFRAIDGKVEVGTSVEREDGVGAATVGMKARETRRSRCGLTSMGVPGREPRRLPQPQVSSLMRSVASAIQGSEGMASR